MEKHIPLVGILNIVYRSIVILGAIVLVMVAVGFENLMDFLVRTGSITPPEVPWELLEIVPAILVVVAIVTTIVSIVGIVAAAGVLKMQSWGRVLLLVISFINILRIPLGTALGAYSIWVLMNDETIRLFGSAPGASVRTPSV